MGNSPVTLILLMANLGASLYAFQNPGFMYKYMFRIDAILERKEYFRLLSSGFLHGSQNHLLVNMLSLYFCGTGVEQIFGPVWFSVIYFGSLVGGNLLSLLMHRYNGSYSALGASGAISGIIFALVYLVPNTIFLLFFIIPCPAWLFAILFVGYSIFGMQTRHGNIGHEAHLGGAAVGMVLAILIMPSFLEPNWWIVLLLLVPTLVALYMLYQSPTALTDLVKGKLPFGKGRGRKGKIVDFRSGGGPYGKGSRNQERPSRQQEMDALLDKVAKKGWDGLSREEQERLNELSGR